MWSWPTNRPLTSPLPHRSAVDVIPLQEGSEFATVVRRAGHLLMLLSILHHGRLRIPRDRRAYVVPGIHVLPNRDVLEGQTRDGPMLANQCLARLTIPLHYTWPLLTRHTCGPANAAVALLSIAVVAHRIEGPEDRAHSLVVAVVHRDVVLLINHIDLLHTLLLPSRVVLPTWDKLNGFVTSRSMISSRSSSP